MQAEGDGDLVTELIVVRHGETDWNVEGRLQGHRSVRLNDRGLLQAKRVADRLSGGSFDALYSSDLERAKQTARAIAEASRATVTPEASLREWALGVLEGRTRAEAKAAHPEAYAMFQGRDPEDVIPGGESIRQRYRRTTACAEALAGRHPNGRIVVVTHGGPLDDFRRCALDIPLEAPRDFKLYNGSLNVFRVERGQWEMTRWGDTRHLEGVGAMGEW